MPLSRFFSWLDRALRADVEAGERRTRAPFASLAGDRSLAQGRAALPEAALLSVDDGGQLLLMGADRLTLGHLRAARADLCFLADLGALHAELAREDSLTLGPQWRITPCAGERVSVQGERVSAAGRLLAPGALVRLGENLEFTFRLPDPASASAVLELLRGAECCGARRIVLFAPGAGGKVRVGSAQTCHVRVPNLDFELELVRDGAQLLLSSAVFVAQEPGAGEAGSSVRRCPFPPRQRQPFTCGAPRGSRPPFELSLEPLERPGWGGAQEPARP